MVNFTPGKILLYWLSSKLGGPHSWSGSFGREQARHFRTVQSVALSSISPTSTENEKQETSGLITLGPANFLWQTRTLVLGDVQQRHLLASTHTIVVTRFYHQPPLQPSKRPFNLTNHHEFQKISPKQKPLSDQTAGVLLTHQFIPHCAWCPFIADIDAMLKS
jgi:hypothetical protein